MNGITSEQFFTEFIEFVDQLVMKSAKLIIIGDFNIPWDVQYSADTKRLIDLYIHLIYSRLSLSPHMRMETQLILLFPARHITC